MRYEVRGTVPLQRPTERYRLTRSQSAVMGAERVWVTVRVDAPDQETALRLARSTMIEMTLYPHPRARGEIEMVVEPVLDSDVIAHALRRWSWVQTTEQIEGEKLGAAAQERLRALLPQALRETRRSATEFFEPGTAARLAGLNLRQRESRITANRYGQTPALGSLATDARFAQLPPLLVLPSLAERAPDCHATSAALLRGTLAAVRGEALKESIAAIEPLESKEAEALLAEVQRVIRLLIPSLQELAGASAGVEISLRMKSAPASELRQSCREQAASARPGLDEAEQALAGFEGHGFATLRALPLLRGIGKAVVEPIRSRAMPIAILDQLLASARAHGECCLDVLWSVEKAIEKATRRDAP